MFRILILSIGLLFAAELEVDGVIKANSGIDANNNPITNVGAPLTMSDAINGNVLQDALRDDGLYEYIFIMVYISNPGQITNPSANHFKKFNGIESISDEHSINLFHGYVSALLNDGWRLEAISGSHITWWIFKKPIEE